MRPRPRAVPGVAAVAALVAAVRFWPAHPLLAVGALALPLLAVGVGGVAARSVPPRGRVEDRGWFWVAVAVAVENAAAVGAVVLLGLSFVL